MMRNANIRETHHKRKATIVSRPKRTTKNATHYIIKMAGNNTGHKGKLFIHHQPTYIFKSPHSQIRKPFSNFQISTFSNYLMAFASFSISFSISMRRFAQSLVLSFAATSKFIAKKYGYRRISLLFIDLSCSL